MLTSKELKELKKEAKEVRKSAILMSLHAKSAHLGGALSCVEILVALYFKILKNNPQKPDDSLRDRLVFSKAHDAKALYAVLAQKGYFPKNILDLYEVDKGKLPGHSTRHCVPGVEVSAGSLGHGLSMAAGMALAGKLDKKKFRVFAVLSDGECDEGSTWEAIFFSGYHELDNLIAIIDYNKLQGFGFTKDVLDLEPFGKKWSSFGWSVKKVNGHNLPQIIKTLKNLPFEKRKPSVLICDTIKGLGGISAHVNQVSSQYKPPTQEEAIKAIRKLDE